MKKKSKVIKGVPKKEGLFCPECGSSKLIFDAERGEYVCTSCGLVILERVMDEGPDWRAFTLEEKEIKKRGGAPLSIGIHDRGLSTSITMINKDASGRILPIEKRLEMLRLKKWQVRAKVHSSRDRNLVQAIAELDRMMDSLRYPTYVKDQAIAIYRNVLDRGIIRGRSIAGMMAACLYLACRFLGFPTSIREIAKASRLDKKEIGRCYRMLVRELGDSVQIPSPDPNVYVENLVRKLGLGHRVLRKSIELLEKLKTKRALAGKNPIGIATAVVYIACVLEGVKKTQRELAKAAGVTEVTVRNRYKDIIKLLKKEYPALKNLK